MRSIVAECIGTALLVAAVVGSGIMGERLAGGNTALALLANSIATGAVLVTLIFTFAPISGAHFNPAVSLASAIEGALPWRLLPAYVAAQVGGAVADVLIAHVMFEHPLVTLSRHARSGGAQLFSELVATFGLLVVVHGTGKRAAVVPLTVAAYITAAYWFTSSTSFANPAVTIAQGLTDTFTGIDPAGIPGFIGAQLAGALLATFLCRWLARRVA
ncbi:MAG TPA: MIP/aquaporin family protein [Thermoanaerobaculia bacterium]|nr:MIP/aquaporin family protein [Thermoanaerobaculia bacterium]